MREALPNQPSGPASDALHPLAKNANLRESSAPPHPDNPAQEAQRAMLREVQEETKEESKRSMQGDSGAGEGEREHTGKWSEEEHQRLLEALHKFGNQWKKVSQYVRTRSTTQIRSHTQKHFAKMRLNELRKLANDPTHPKRIFIITREYLNRTPIPPTEIEVPDLSVARRARPKRPNPNLKAKSKSKPTPTPTPTATAMPTSKFKSPSPSPTTPLQASSFPSPRPPPPPAPPPPSFFAPSPSPPPPRPPVGPKTAATSSSQPILHVPKPQYIIPVLGTVFERVPAAPYSWPLQSFMALPRVVCNLEPTPTVGAENPTGPNRDVNISGGSPGADQRLDPHP